MADQTYRATLGAILTLTTGKMLAPLDEWYGLQDFLAGRSLMTHERTTNVGAQVAVLLAQFPRLAEVEPPDFAADDSGSKEPAVRTWVSAVAEHVGWSEADVVWVPGCEVDPGEAFKRIFRGGDGS